MVNKKFIHSVENQCKNTRKSQCKSIAKKCVKILSIYKFVQKLTLFTTFSKIVHSIFHNYSPLYFNYFFHYSTYPTITTINKLIRKD